MSHGRWGWGIQWHRRLGFAAGIAALVGVGVLDGVTRAAEAVEQVELIAPFSNAIYTIRVAELANSQALLSGTSDLAELDRALNGAIGKQLIEVFHKPLPLSEGAFDKDSGSPLLQQVLLMLAELGELDGLHTNEMDAAALAKAVDQASAGGQITMLSLLQALPGKTVRVDLPKVVQGISRNAQQRVVTNKLLKTGVPISADPSLAKPGPNAVIHRELSLAVGHRPLPLTLVVLQPQANPNGRLVVISHGLWDSPTNFEGWARHLASYGYTVVLPVHPGSDQKQQRAMLAGEAPPPTPEELRLRPMDVSAVLDGIAAGKLAGVQGIQVQSTVVVGHSWGAITALQLAGGRSSSGPLRQHCGDLHKPERSLSWILQCSFVSTADAPPQPDARVKSVVAVSPPIGLLFSPDAVQGIQARVLLVSGSNDWVVPPDPEALIPFSQSPAFGHRLVLVKGGDHFNMRAPAKANSPAKTTSPAKAPSAAVLSPLILAWVNGTFAAGNQALPAAGAPSLLPPSGWGSAVMPMVDVTVEQAARVVAP